jgi:hypothetical protein
MIVRIAGDYAITIRTIDLPIGGDGALLATGSAGIDIRISSA